MPNICLTLEYDGSAFHGWQKQAGLRTIEGELHRVLEMVLRVAIPHVSGSGRTDAGVHARGQVVTFEVPQTPDLDELSYSVNGIFRGELAVIDAKIVADDFHARFDAKRKQYTYTIYQRKAPPVMERQYVWHIRSPLPLERLKEEVKSLIGLHDFTSFRGAGCTADSPVREILESELTLDGAYLRYRVVGTGFLRQMVRNIVGTLVDLGREKLDLKSMREILEARDRNKGGTTAPPQGLCLDWVGY